MNDYEIKENRFVQMQKNLFHVEIMIHEKLGEHDFFKIVIIIVSTQSNFFETFVIPKKTNIFLSKNEDQPQPKNKVVCENESFDIYEEW